MATQPDPNPDIIEPGSPDEFPSTNPPDEAPTQEPPEIDPVQPDFDRPDRGVPETPPPPD